METDKDLAKFEEEMAWGNQGELGVSLVLVVNDREALGTQSFDVAARTYANS